ncbi:MAG: hypothetical protein IJ583_08660 [Firmicutes bacterium]|nr:hypothetical protein [Bacillota bacterium]
MKKNKIISCILLGTLMVAITACGSAATTTTSDEAETKPAKTATVESDKTKVSDMKEKKISSEGNARVKDIAGVWFEDALDPRTLTIDEDGTFTLEYKGGGFKSGIVTIDYEVFGDGSQRAWYNLSEDGDENWISFSENDDGSQLLDILAYDEDGEVHFRRDIAIRDEGLDEPNEYGFFPVTSVQPTGISIAVLDGIWKSDNGDAIVFYDGDIFTGSFDVTYADKTIDEGYVQLEYSLNPDDSREYWYNLYKNDGEFFLGFGVSGDIPLNDLYAGQSGEPHYTRESDDSISGSAEDFFGIWACGRVTADIADDPASEYITVDIHWSSSASEGSTWRYYCTYDESANVLRCDGLGSRLDYSYAEDGTFTDSSVYDESDAVFEIRNGALIWSDDNENMDDGLSLLR